MPQIIYAPRALRDLQRLREFLQPKNPAAAKRATEAILKAVKKITRQPQIGRLIEELPNDYREWPIDFGDSGYVARYRFDADAITILAVRHQKEVGF
jgi:plasmid stabilization system protein ParE